MNETLTEYIGRCVDLRLSNGESEIIVTQIGDSYMVLRWKTNLETSLKGNPVMMCSLPETLVEWLAARNYEIRR